jgi:tetratricopeptide (TPR) repeat protein
MTSYLLKIKNRLIHIIFVCFLILIFSSCAEKKREITFGQDYEEYLYLKDRIQKHSHHIETYIYLGEACMMLGKNEEMEASYTAVLKADPPAPPSILSEAHRRLGLIWLETLRQDQSREEMRIIEKTYPWDRSVYDLDGHYWYAMHKNFRGFSVFAGEFVNPTCANGFVGAGNIQRAMGNLKIAEDIYRAGNVFDVEDPFLRSCLGNLLGYQKRYDEAEKALQKAISGDPELGYFYVCMGNLKRDMGKLQEALTWHEKALSIDPRSDEYAYAGIGEVCLAMAEKEREATTVLQTSAVFLLTLIPMLILSVIIYRFRKDNSHGGRKQFIKKMFLIFIITLAITETAGLLLLNGNNFLSKKYNPRNFYCQKSIEAFDKAIRINPYRKDLRTNYAKAFRCINRIKDAQAEEAIAELLPEYDWHASLKFNHP